MTLSLAHILKYNLISPRMVILQLLGSISLGLHFQGFIYKHLDYTPWFSGLGDYGEGSFIGKIFLIASVMMLLTFISPIGAIFHHEPQDEYARSDRQKSLAVGFYSAAFTAIIAFFITWLAPNYASQFHVLFWINAPLVIGLFATCVALYNAERAIYRANHPEDFMTAV